MFSRFPAVLFAGALASAGPALAAEPSAQEMNTMATHYNCFACHSLDKKVVGPAFRDIGKKYADQASAAEKLAVKIAKGGAGTWGPIPMPANPQVAPDKMPLLVTWILAGAPTE